MEPIHLRLFVSGATPRSARALENLQRLCAPLNGVRLDVIDVVEDPQAAETGRIVATPTLIRVSPTPVRRLIGDLSDATAVALSLDLPLRQPEDA